MMNYCAPNTSGLHSNPKVSPEMKIKLQITPEEFFFQAANWGSLMHHRNTLNTEVCLFLECMSILFGFSRCRN